MLVSINDTLILSDGYGSLDSAHRTKPADTTLFNIASITKSFTAMALVRLAAEGRLSVSDTLARFFPGLPMDKRGITLDQCLLHTSGLGQRYASDGLTTRAEAVAAIGSDTLQDKPGNDFHYSNENYELLAAVVEMATGMDHESYLETNVLRPCDLRHTLFWRDVDSLAAPMFAPALPQQAPAFRGRDWGYVGSGGLFSSARDLHKWFTAIESGRSLWAAQRDTLWRPRGELSVGQLGYGWFISTTKGEKEIWTRGTESWGHNAVVRWFPGRRVLIIVLTNSGEMGDQNSTGNRTLSEALVDVLLM